MILKGKTSNFTIPNIQYTAMVTVSKHGHKSYLAGQSSQFRAEPVGGTPVSGGAGLDSSHLIPWLHNIMQ